LSYKASAEREGGNVGIFDFLREKRGPGSCWEWLGANTERIKATIRQRPDDVMKEINSVFQALDERVLVEIAPSPDGEWELCLTADGCREVFPAIIEAVRGAPPVPGWKVRALQPSCSSTTSSASTTPPCACAPSSVDPCHPTPAKRVCAC
jgi:hypothetical protein